MSSKVGVSLLGFAAVLSAGLLIMSTETVSEGSVAVVYSTSGVKEEPLKAGWHLISPIEKTVEYPVRNQTLVADGISAVTLDGKKFSVDVKYQYETDVKKVVSMYKTHGKQDLQTVEVIDKTKKNGKVIESHEAIKSVALTQDMQKIVKEIISQFSLDEVYRTKTSEVNALILSAITEKEAEKGFIIKDVTVGVPKLDKTTQAAMDAQVSETQAQQLKHQQLETAKIDAEQKKVVAEGEAEKAKIEAQAQADAALIKAQSEKEANEMKKQTLTAELLQQQWIEKWNGTLPTVSSDDTSLMMQMPAAE